MKAEDLMLKNRERTASSIVKNKGTRLNRSATVTIIAEGVRSVSLAVNWKIKLPPQLTKIILIKSKQMPPKIKRIKNKIKVTDFKYNYSRTFLSKIILITEIRNIQNSKCNNTIRIKTLVTYKINSITLKKSKKVK
jgi:hypothetical protein